jgi:hypothetical protein
MNTRIEIPFPPPQLPAPGGRMEVPMVPVEPRAGGTLGIGWRRFCPQRPPNRVLTTSSSVHLAPLTGGYCYQK